VQKFFYERREALKPWAINAIPVLKGVADYYGQRIGQTANKEWDGKKVIAKLEIDRTAYNPINRLPVLFGSSIKGAIRTALLNQVNGKQPLSMADAQNFSLENLNPYERKARLREQNRIFPELNRRLFKITKGKFEFDPLRLLQISDAAWNENEQSPSTQVLVSVNRKKELKRDKHGNEIFSQAEKNENLCKLLESIPAWRYRAFSGHLNLQNIDCVKNSGKTPNAELIFNIEQIAQFCSKHYLPILKAEMKDMRTRGFLDNEWDKSIQGLLEKMTDKLLSGRAFILRVGRHSGAESVTIDGVRHIKIMKGNPEYQSKTKTLWLAANDPKQRTNLLPFGWLLVEIHSHDAPVSECQELAELCQLHNKSMQSWIEKQFTQKQEFIQKRKEAEAKRQEEKIEIEKIKQKEYQDQQDKLAAFIAEQQRLANLSPLDQELEAFLKPIQASEHDTRLLKELESGRWQNEDAKLVAEKVKALMEKENKWMPDFAGTNDKKLKLKERSQKVMTYLQG
jgi:CRISPR-associated protein Csm5